MSLRAGPAASQQHRELFLEASDMTDTEYASEQFPPDEDEIEDEG